ncbi:hypothetical protein RJ639_006597 [Escallonia herrerae]|uniref:Trichome birefringence-like C-terminal domain-containing protein n=1 Tax=Escallonia herrerae TaxID=1293975 RepID=A0AA88W3P8_9ASTE|nr:hypothetical protein RJ639_006597 [Escallonia herrerae]
MDVYFAANLNAAEQRIPSSLRMSFQAALNHINQCKARKSILSILRKSSPFDNGSWNAGGNCSRTSPQNESEVETGGQHKQFFTAADRFSQTSSMSVIHTYATSNL